MAIIPDQSFAEEPNDKRRADLLHLLDVLLPSRPPAHGRMNAHDVTWEDWVRRTGELPPDFETMPAQAGLPDPFGSGEEAHRVRKEWIQDQLQHWIFGTMPPAPDNLRVAAAEESEENGITIRRVRLEFGPEHRGRLNLELMIPPGEGPFPVFLTNHSRARSPWVRTAVNRGYLACFYQATDPMYGLPDDSDGFIEVYPEYDFSVLGRWAWAGSRAVDYLVGLPEVSAKQIGIAGHSRNGKQALLAAAMDERIGAVVASSGLTGEVNPWRLTSDPYGVESIQLLTGAQPHWFHPRLRFFAGREHKLPVDQNMLMALIAPRGLMFYSAYSEGSANAFVLEQSYRDVLRTYRQLGAEENVWLHLREGEHATEVADVENFLDFFDTVFRRKTFPKVERWIHGYTFEGWRETSRFSFAPADFPVREGGWWRELGGATWEERREELRENLLWTLGDAPALLPPASAPTALAPHSPPPRNPLELVFGRPLRDENWKRQLAAEGMGVSGVTFGPGLQADLFYPADADGEPVQGKFPVVVWLHPYTHAHGWSARRPWQPRQPNFNRDQRPEFGSLVRRGFIVVAFDQIGFGSRAHEARSFYQRYPDWSLLGKMVSDTRALLDALVALGNVDPSRVQLLGYSLGGKVGLVTAAMDDRVAGVTAVSSLYPIRHDGGNPATEGVGHYSHLHGLLPRLGFFIGEEARSPFSYEEVLALVAPRRVLVVAPELDRFHPVEQVRAEVEAAGGAFRLAGEPEALKLWTPRDFNRFPRKLQERVFDYLREAAQAGEPRD